MKIFISGADPTNEIYQSAIDNLRIRLTEFGFDVNIESKNLISNYQDILQSKCAYFIDGWFDLPYSRKAFETCHNNGIPVMFQKPMPYYKDFAETFDLLNAIYKITGVSFGEMRSPKRDERTFFARVIYAWICIDQYKIRPTRVGKILNRGYSAISHQIETCKSLAESPCDKGFKNMCNAVYEELFGNKVMWDYKSNNGICGDSWTAGDSLYCELDNMDWQDVFGLPGCPQN